MNSEPCRICKNKASTIHYGKLINHDVCYYECPNCNYVQTEYPTWLNEAYSSAINISDTGILSRNFANVSFVLASLAALNLIKGTVVDYAGGYGLLVRLLRDKGLNAFWMDQYCENLVSRGFEYISGKADLITAFEAFEHFTNPIDELKKMLSIAPNVLFSTALIPQPAPKFDEWWYYGREHGQHIGFFRLKTLNFLAQKFKKHLISDGRSVHMLVDRPISYAKWKLLCKLTHFLPKLFTHGLKSKTWTDHIQLSTIRDSTIQF